MGAEEAAQTAGTSRATVKRAALSGELPYALKMPGHTGAYLFTRQAVEQWAKARNAVTSATTEGSAA